MKEIIIGKIVGFVYWLYSLSFRYQVHFENEEAKLSYEQSFKVFPNINSNVLFAIWHQDEIALLSHFNFRQIVVMVSDSKDGAMFSNALHFIGYKTVRGSSSRGGVKALLAAIKVIEKGYSLVIATDGPKGPLYKVKEGIHLVSKKTGKAILPVRARPRSCYTFNKAWSKSRLPYPFSIVDIFIGAPKSYSSKELEIKLLSFDS